VQHDTTGHSDPQESGAEVEQIDLIKTVRWLEGGTGRSTSNVLPELSEQTSYAAALATVTTPRQAVPVTKVALRRLMPENHGRPDISPAPWTRPCAAAPCR
jgi:hypothetical protein